MMRRIGLLLLIRIYKWSKNKLENRNSKVTVSSLIRDINVTYGKNLPTESEIAKYQIRSKEIIEEERKIQEALRDEYDWQMYKDV